MASFTAVEPRVGPQVIQPNPSPSIRCYIYEVDGLLIKSEDIYANIYNDILHSHGKPALSWSKKARQRSRGGSVSSNSGLTVPIFPNLPSFHNMMTWFLQYDPFRHASPISISSYT